MHHGSRCEGGEGGSGERGGGEGASLLTRPKEREVEVEEGLEREEEVEEGLEREEQVEESLLARPLVVLQRHYKVRLRRLRRRRCGREFCTVSPRPQYHGNGQRASSEPNVSKGGHNPMIQRGLNWHRMNIKALTSPPVNC